ncbi:hypothetical protein LXL04_037231 [Taraxacum kok-saghyz]
MKKNPVNIEADDDFVEENPMIGWTIYARMFNKLAIREIFSFSFGGVGDNLLDAGCKSQLKMLKWKKTVRVNMDQIGRINLGVDVTPVKISFKSNKS